MTEWMEPCGSKAAHERHGLCWGVTEEGEKRMRFRSRYREHWAPVTRDDADYDGGLSTMREGGQFR